MDLAQLQTIVAEHAAIRRRQVLQPAGGKGDKIFPPTYPAERNNEPPRHVYEKRKLDGREIWCVLVDSVASQANRLEDALSAAVDEGLSIPHVFVDFSCTDLPDIGRITSLQAPHRVYDAIFRDSLLNGQAFMKSALGRRLAEARPENASALLEVSPTALLFGAWHSTGEGGGLGAKFARCLVSEIVAIDVPVEEVVGDRRTGEVTPRTLGRRVGSRIDPLGILRAVEVYKGEADWGTSADQAGKGGKKVRPSEINHGNIAPSVQPLGVTCDHLEHGFVLSCAALRRLRFGGDERDAAGRTLLAALGLVAVAEQDARGYALRSRCDLVCDGAAPFEIVHRDGSTEPLALDRETARGLWTEVFDHAKKAGFTLREPIRLEPQPKLVEIVKKSRELALAGRGGEAENEEG
ncbi:MAG: type I-U CRISPR-associated protein Cas7 [Geminicoccaceae bacterium]|nr:type I-U CRISPR-associated protein Cas7 [Geminicoccaceae bacterium]